MSGLLGKGAVLTGSTSGIGLGIARALGNAGANLVLNGFGDASAIAADARWDAVIARNVSACFYANKAPLSIDGAWTAQ